MTSEQIYKKNKTKSKVFSILGPVSWYLLVVLTCIFCILAFENSVGNVIEILDLLDTKTYNDVEIENNYNMLVSKWGEWQIGTRGISARYINVANALFSGLMVVYVSLTIAAFLSAIVFGKIVFPSLSKMYKNRNEEMVDLATLKSAGQIDKIAKSKEWF